MDKKEPKTEPITEPADGNEPKTEPATEPAHGNEPKTEPVTEPADGNEPKTEPATEPADGNEPKTEPATEPADGNEPKTEPTAQPAEPHPAADTLTMELLNAKAQLAAFKCGIRADVVEDAVCLAVNDAKKSGEVTEDSISQALSGVLNRHPEWKHAPDNTNGFRVGADGSKQPSTSNDEISKIFGNK